MAYLFVMLSGCLWGCMGTIFKFLQPYGITSPQTAAYRMLIASILAGLILLLRNRQAFRVSWRQLFFLFLSGGVGSGIYNLTYFMAVEETAVSFAAAMSYTAPGFVTIFSIFLFRERLTRQKLCALAMTLAGCVLVTGVLQSGGASYSLYGILLGLAAGFFYAMYSLFLKKAILAGCSGDSATFYCVLFPFVVVLPFSHLPQSFPALAEPRCLLLLLALGCLCAAVPSALYSWGMTRVESGKAAMIATVDLVVSTILGVVLFRDPLSALQIVGILLILGAVATLSYQKPAKSAQGA